MSKKVIYGNNIEGIFTEGKELPILLVTEGNELKTVENHTTNGNDIMIYAKGNGGHFINKSWLSTYGEVVGAEAGFLINNEKQFELPNQDAKGDYISLVIYDDNTFKCGRFGWNDDPRNEHWWDVNEYDRITLILTIARKLIENGEDVNDCSTALGVHPDSINESYFYRFIARFSDGSWGQFISQNNSPASFRAWLRSERRDVVELHQVDSGGSCKQGLYDVEQKKSIYTDYDKENRPIANVIAFATSKNFKYCQEDEEKPIGPIPFANLTEYLNSIDSEQLFKLEDLPAGAEFALFAAIDGYLTQGSLSDYSHTNTYGVDGKLVTNYGRLYAGYTQKIVAINKNSKASELITYGCNADGENEKKIIFARNIDGINYYRLSYMNFRGMHKNDLNDFEVGQIIPQMSYEDLALPKEQQKSWLYNEGTKRYNASNGTYDLKGALHYHIAYSAHLTTNTIITDQKWQGQDFEGGQGLRPEYTLLLLEGVHNLTVSDYYNIKMHTPVVPYAKVPEKTIDEDYKNAVAQFEWAWKIYKDCIEINRERINQAKELEIKILNEYEFVDEFETELIFETEPNAKDYKIEHIKQAYEELTEEWQKCFKMNVELMMLIDEQIEKIDD